jgi:phage terminase large subunit-like protein
MSWTALILLMGGKRGAIALCVAGGLLLVLLALSIAYGVQGSHLTAARAEVESKNTAITALEGRLATANDRVAEVNTANEAWKVEFGQLKDLYDKEVEARVARQEADAKAIAAAQAARARAEDATKEWMNRYAHQIRQPACDVALKNLEAACPLLENY